MCELGQNKHAATKKVLKGTPRGLNCNANNLNSENIELGKNEPTENGDDVKSRVGRPKKTSTPENMIRLDVSREDRVKNITRKMTPRTRELTLLELAKG